MAGSNSHEIVDESTDGHEQEHVNIIEKQQQQQVSSFEIRTKEQQVRAVGYFEGCSKYVDENKESLLVVLCVIVTSLDPLFCYIFLVDEHRICVGFDKNLRTIFVVLRSITDFLSFIIIIFYCNVHNYCSYNDDNETHEVSRRVSKLYLFSSILNVFGVLPLPQVLVLFFLPSSKGLQFIYAIWAFLCVLLIQYLSRFIRIYLYLKQYGWSTIFPRAAEAKALFNLLLYLIASHVIGAFWYLFTIERKTTCWQGRCQRCPLNCNYVLGINVNNNAHNFCSAGAENRSKTFNFGIFEDAVHMVHSKDFFKKFYNCFWWGLQKLSSLGQDLKTSGHLLEICFAVYITISGLILFALLIGNLQTQLQSTFSSLEQMRLNEKNIKMCTKNYDFPPGLQKQIRISKPHKWQEPNGEHITQLLQNLPPRTCREIKRHICKDLVPRVLSKLRIKEDNKLWDEIYDNLTPMLYPKCTSIIKKDYIVDEIVFKIRGHVCTKANDFSMYVSPIEDDFWGEELVDWVLHGATRSTPFPKSEKTLRSSSSEVEAFILTAKDLKDIFSKYKSSYVKKGSNDIVPSQRDGKNNDSSLEHHRSQGHVYSCFGSTSSSK